MEKVLTNGTKKKFILYIITVLIVLSACQFFILRAISNSYSDKKEQNAYVYGQSVAESIRLTLDKSLQSSESLKYFYITYGDDCFEQFNSFASEIAKDNPAIGSVYIAPKAVIQVAYPQEVNESTIGFEMLKDPDQGPSAQLAIDTKKITVAGPHNLVEGGEGFIIRNPIFDGDEFVGFTIVVLNWDLFVDQVLENTSYDAAIHQYKYAVWKDVDDAHAVSDEQGYIFKSSDGDFSRKIDIEIEVPNDLWHLTVEPLDGWSVYGEIKNYIYISVGISLVILALSILVFNSEFKKRRYQREAIEARTREEYTQQLKDALEMAHAANESKTQFLFNMSHDIRTPMNAIMGFTEIALKNLENTERLQDCLDKIYNSGKLLLSLINNILDMSRIESGKAKLEENPGDVYLSFSNIETTMQELAAAKHIDLSFEFGEVTDRYVLCDFNRCVRVFVNIITNAIKYTPNGGKVHVKCEQTGSQDGMGIYKYTFEDNGIGMSEEFQKHVFDEFAREETSTVSGIQGTGLGLAVCKTFVTAMNGQIVFKSKQGEGTTFIVVLPMKIQDGQEYTNPSNGRVISANKMDEEIDVSSVNFAGKHVLLVEDNELNQDIATDILSEEGMFVDTAGDGAIAVEILKEKGPSFYDFILMDIQMPIMNGYEATQAIREMYPNEFIPIIALSANAFSEDKAASIAAGMNDHVAKPINIKELMESLAKFIK